MQEPQPIFRVLVRTDSYEPERDFGAYATRELAEQVATALYEAWDPEDSFRPERSAFRVAQEELHTAAPVLHLWAATVDLETAEEVQACRLSTPYLKPTEPTWEVLAEPAKYVRHPMRFVVGSGQTPEEALANAWRHYEKAVSLGAVSILAKCTELSDAALAEAERREAEGYKDEEGNVRPAWQMHTDLLHEMAEAHWGVPERDLP